MIIRAKTKTLFEGKELSKHQQENSKLNLWELENRGEIVNSLPRRFVFELTNNCNLNCMMCGRLSGQFKPTTFQMEWLRYFEPMLNQVEEVTLMGWGEPTVHPHFVDMLRIIDGYSARKYFCTNGMRLHILENAIFDYNVDVFAVSVDGAKQETNDRIRRGSDFQQICKSLKSIVARREQLNRKYPYINFVFCAMKSNFREIPQLVQLAADIGIEEVKVVYLTVFDKELLSESLWGMEKEVEECFQDAERLAGKLGIVLKLPYVSGTDIAEQQPHRDCYVPWRDFFLGSDGYVRSCMSTPVKFFAFDPKKDFTDMWNHRTYQEYRRLVNDQTKMPQVCKRCYQSSFCNWNQKHAFLQIGNDFLPEWEENK